MTQDEWLGVLARLTDAGPFDLDAGPREGRRGAGLAGWTADHLPPSPRLWERPESDATYIGVRVDNRIADCIAVAVRLAAVAVEREVNPIILTGLPNSGFERFGFRVERFVDSPGVDREAWEAEMTAFWDLALIIDATDVAALS